MASTQTWSEYNGAGQTETGARSECNWKNIDDSTTLYSSAPIAAGNNSYSKYQALKFAGTWNQLSSLTYKVSSAAPATGITVAGAVVTAYITPATTATGDGAASTSGAAVQFGTSTNPFSTAGGATVAGGGTIYANAFRTQLQTTGSAGPGDIPGVTITAQWTES